MTEKFRVMLQADEGQKMFYVDPTTFKMSNEPDFKDKDMIPGFHITNKYYNVFKDTDEKKFCAYVSSYNSAVHRLNSYTNTLKGVTLSNVSEENIADYCMMLALIKDKRWSLDKLQPFKEYYTNAYSQMFKQDGIHKVYDKINFLGYLMDDENYILTESGRILPLDWNPNYVFESMNLSEQVQAKLYCLWVYLKHGKEEVDHLAETSSEIRKRIYDCDDLENMIWKYQATKELYHVKNNLLKQTAFNLLDKLKGFRR